MLTCHVCDHAGPDDDVVEGLEAGADDDGCKPFASKVLLARVRRCLDRSRRVGPSDDILHHDRIRIDTARRAVYLDVQRDVRETRGEAVPVDDLVLALERAHRDGGWEAVCALAGGADESAPRTAPSFVVVDLELGVGAASVPPHRRAQRRDRGAGRHGAVAPTVIADIAHELRTPVTNIKGLLERLVPDCRELATSDAGRLVLDLQAFSGGAGRSGRRGAAATGQPAVSG